MTAAPLPEPTKPGQESVWDYPRPPRIEEFVGSITVELGGHTIASTNRAWRILETSHPPTYYLPRESFADGSLRAATGSSWCEWKGRARYYDLVTATTSAPRSGVDLRRPDAAVPCHCRRHRRNGGTRRPRHRQRRTGSRPAGRVLRRLDHQPGGWALQGNARVGKMVSVTAPSMMSMGATR
jgi:uncharacterized protein (DUF427 family)